MAAWATEMKVREIFRIEGTSVVLFYIAVRFGCTPIIFLATRYWLLHAISILRDMVAVLVLKRSSTLYMVVYDIKKHTNYRWDFCKILKLSTIGLKFCSSLSNPECLLCEVYNGNIYVLIDIPYCVTDVDIVLK